jgi:hypothetical protein
LPKEVEIEIPNFKIDTAERAVATQVGFNDCLKQIKEKMNNGKSEEYK